jgi:transcriptional regulator with XRE-family HTH domain
MTEAISRPIEEWLTTLSERLVRNRLRRNLTQQDLAKAAGISLRTLARLENGEPVRFESFLRTLIALGLEKALGGLVPEVPESPMEQIMRDGRRRQRATGGGLAPLPDAVT